jgi:hypothetical protein
VPTGRLPSDVALVLSSAQRLWERIRPGGRDRVVRAVQDELLLIRSLLGPCDAAAVLAERLRSRVAEQGGVPVRDAVGWLVGRGLRQRPGCWSSVCDDGVDLASGQNCRACKVRADGRRAVRFGLLQQVREQLPGAGPDAVRAELEVRLRQESRDQAQETVHRHLAARSVVEERREKSTARAAQADRAQAAALARPCRGCGLADSGGWCGRCADRAAVQSAVGEARRVAAAGWLPGGCGAEELAGVAEARVWGAVQAAVECSEQAGGGPDMTGPIARLVAETECAKVREEVLQRLETSPQAQEEGRQAAWVESRRQQFAADRRGARAAVGQAAAAARARVAEALLHQRLAPSDEDPAQGDQAGSAPGVDGRGSRVQRLLALADRPLEEESLGATA